MKESGRLFAEWLVQRDAATLDLMESLDALGKLAPMQSAAAFMALAEFIGSLENLRIAVMAAIDTAYPSKSMDEIDADWSSDESDDTETVPPGKPRTMN